MGDGGLHTVYNREVCHSDGCSVGVLSVEVKG